MKKKKQPNAISPPTLSGFFVNNVTSQKSKYGIYIEGLNSKPASNIHIADCDFENVEKDYFIKDARDLHVKNTIVNGKKMEIK